MAQQQLFLGIDGGGTKTKARLETGSGELLGEALAGPANPAQNADLALSSILQASRQALQNAGLKDEVISQLNVCMGLAGVNIPKYHTTASQWQLPFHNVEITTDLHIACAGAHSGKEGAILITGTGCSAFASINNVHTTLGGHGFPIGDKSSGAWIGWRAVSLTLEAMDGLRKTSPLIQAVLAKLEAKTTSDLVGETLHYRAQQFATLAPLVIEHSTNDHNAQLIMTEGAAYLSSLANRLLILQPNRFSIIGGLAMHWSRWLPESIQQQLQPALCSPEYGAVALAKHFQKEA